MPSLMIFRRVLELQELKNQVSQSFRPNHDAQMFEFYFHFLHGKKIGRIGTNFGISFLQTEASLKKARGSERERATFECEMIYASPLSFFTKAT